MSSCGDGNNPNNLPPGGPGGPLMGAAYDPRMSFAATADSSNGSVRFDEPRFNNSGAPMKLWSYGNAFAALGGNVTFREHAESACVLLAGPNSRYETHNESGFVPYGEPGVILSAVGFQGGVREVIRFGEIDLPYWRADTSRYMQSITCRVGPGGARTPNQPYPQQPQGCRPVGGQGAYPQGYPQTYPQGNPQGYPQGGYPQNNPRGGCR